MNRPFRLPVMLLLAGCLLLPLQALARIKLITLPVRDRVEIQLDHPDLTLVEELRTVPLIAGINQVDFSWANTRIDPDSIVFRVVGTATDKATAKVLSVSYPPNESALVWRVSASHGGPVQVRISYVIGQLNRQFDYRAVADTAEKTLTMSQYLSVKNHANEAFGDAWLSTGFGDQHLKPIGINETRRLLIEKYRKVPVNKTYTADYAQFGWLDERQQKLKIPMHYVLKNDAANGLGKAALPYGKVRIFQQDGQGSEAFLGEDWGRYTPLDEEMALFLGIAKDVVVKRTIEKNEQQRISGHLYQHDVVIKYEIENFKDKPVTLTVVENPRRIRDEIRGNSGRDVEWLIGQGTTFQDGPDVEKSSLEHLVHHAKLPPRDKDGKANKLVHRLHLTLKNEW